MICKNCGHELLKDWKGDVVKPYRHKIHDDWKNNFCEELVNGVYCGCEKPEPKESV